MKVVFFKISWASHVEGTDIDRIVYLELCVFVNLLTESNVVLNYTPPVRSVP